MSTRKRTESWKGIEFTRDGERGPIIRARFKRGFPQKWHVIPSRYYGSKQECLAYKENEKLTIDKNDVPDSTIKFGEYADQVLASKQSLGEGTIETYKYRLSSDWIEPLRSHKLVEITRDHILALVKRKKEQLEAEGKQLVRSTLESYLTPVQMIFTHAIENGAYRDVNPVTAISIKDLARPKKKKRILVLKGKTLARLFDALDPMYLCLFALAYYTGGRISELLGLRWEHINMKEENPLRNWVLYEGQLCPRSGEWKNGTKGRKSDDTPRSRYVDLPPALLPILREHMIRMKHRPEDPVFPGLTQRGVQGYIRGYDKRGKHYDGLRDKLGEEFDGTGRWEEFTLHHLRHTYGSLLIESGKLSLKEIAKQMGHTVEVLLSTYAHEIERMERDPDRSAGAVMNHAIGL